MMAVSQPQHATGLPGGIVRQITPLSLWGGDTLIYKSIIALSAAALPVIASVNLYLSGAPSWPQLAAAGAILLGTLLCYALARSGRREVAAMLLIGVLWLTVTIYAFESGYGMHSAAVFVYLPCVLYTSLFFGLAIASFELALTTCVLVLMYLAEERGMLGGASAFVTHGTNFNFLVGVIITSIGTLIVGLAYHRRVEQEAARVVADAEQRQAALVSARDLQAQLQTAHAKLQHLNDELSARARASERELARARRDISQLHQVASRDFPASLRALRDAIARPDEQTEARLLREIDRMEAVAAALDELGREGEPALQRRPLDLSALAQEEARRLRAMDEFSGVRFDVDAGLHAPGDPRLVAALLRHLMRRAAQACRAEPGSLVHFGSGSMHGRAVFFVQDNGLGDAVPPDAPDIGIAVASSIVERHGGELTIDARPGKGTTAFFFLPA